MDISNILKIKLKNGVLDEHYQAGMFKLFELPVHFGRDCDKNNEFFAYISTLGGGLVGGDNYTQDFWLTRSKASLNSQSNQKIYKGRAKLNTRICLDRESCLVFHNDANIFYKDSDFLGKSVIFADKDSRFFFLDGGFLGYGESKFRANMQFRLFIDNKLSLNDNFIFSNKNSVNAFFEYEYFYTIIIRGMGEIPDIKIPSDKIKAHSSKLNGNLIIRILTSSNDVALEYINEAKRYFLQIAQMSGL